jgi:hypothetical protein
MILPKNRDSRLITIRRGGTLTDLNHQFLALWAAACAKHVLHHFELARPEDVRPRAAIEQARGEVKISQARASAGAANVAARDLSGAARHAAYAAGQAAAVAHVAAYVIKAAREQRLPQVRRRALEVLNVSGSANSCRKRFASLFWMTSD